MSREKAGRGARALYIGAVAALAALTTPVCVWAEDIAPKVLPDRIEDVPSTRPDPFPAFANFGWRAFIALSWPSLTDPAHRGLPDRAKTLGDPGPRVWETFKSRSEIFQPRDAAPAKWSSYAGENPCGPRVNNRTKTLSAFNAYADFNQASFTPGHFTGPLVAQNRSYTRYEVRFNEAEFDSLIDYRGRKKEDQPDREHPAQFNLGSIAVKAAWRILTDADTPAVRQRYYVVRNAEVLDVAESLKAGTGVCSKRDIALVGLHIMIKTRYRPQWIWSSFEHVDNVPPVGSGEAREPDAAASHAPYSYYDAAKPPPVMAPEIAAPAPVSAANPPKIDPEPAQILRRLPINPETMAMNRAYWALPELRDTVWANYMLVASQWPTEPQPVGPQNDGRYFPGFRADANTPGEPYQQGDAPPHNLANTMMETYLQGAPSSCMACHHVVSNDLGHDFVAISEFQVEEPRNGAPAAPDAPQSEPHGQFPAVGIVTGVNPAKGYLTISHEDIKGLMPAMEMTFRVEPRALVAEIHRGDKIDFTVDSPSFVIRTVKVIQRAP